ncbi:hypothetical protein B0H34DRAFT_780581 [Crassisporium funariophilum]|nr:hypothetical protein B0H34DRAFT_780581 [Crassisporium funariophilum]
MKAVLIKSNTMWDNGSVLTYAFLDGPPTSRASTNRQAKVRKVITEWELYGNFSFKFVEGDVEGGPIIRITFDASDGSWSFVGKEVLEIDHDKATMNLGWISGDTDVVTSNERGVILHEFGHTLGLMHEHQSPVRGNKITLLPTAVREFYRQSQGWTDEEVDAQIINVYSKQDVSNYSELDLTSIMMYFMPAEMNSEGIEVKPNNVLSEMDKAFIRINFPKLAETSSSDDPNYRTFKAALDIVGVDGEDKDIILSRFSKGDIFEVRYEFSRFCTETRIARKAYGAREVTSDDLEDFEDGCWAEDDDVDSAASTGASRGVATIESMLWLPGEEVTYSWIQGSLQATDYRKKRVAETLAFYATRANLVFKEIPFDPVHLPAKIHIYFGPIGKKKHVTGWCKIGKESVGLRRTLSEIERKGGTAESSICLSDAVPAAEPTDPVAKKVEMRTLFHELGHALGLRHEHNSPNTKTADKVDDKVSLVTLFDENSVMLYANRKLRSDRIWPSIKDDFDRGSTKYNHKPSELDLALLGALYPARKGHVDDRFEEDIKTLGLTSKLKALSEQRDLAFSVEGKPKFIDEIDKFRAMVRMGLTALVAAKAPNAAHGVTGSAPTRARDLTTPPHAVESKKSFLDELVSTLSSLFKPSTGQTFALQFPGRFLQQDLYAWDTSAAGIYGQFVKPTVVNESEFRLVDQLYNVGQVIGAPSGINLSIVYEQVLNNLVPGILDSSINMSKQQDQIRQWLLRDVPTTGWVKDLIASQHTASAATGSTATASNSTRAHASSAINPDAKPQFSVANKLSEDNKVNRMELADALMHEYLAAKQAWELERDDMIKNAKGEDLNDLTRRLAHITSIRESQLASKHADAVVRGYSHVIRQYMGFMDIKTPAEILQDAKDALRESAMSSLDGSMKIYPVQMQPIDWFQSLSTSFTMEDLTNDPDLIAQQIDNKSKQLDFMNTRLAVIQHNPGASVKEIQAKLDMAQDAYDKASSELSTTYTSNVIALARTCINANNEFVLEDFKPAARVAKIADKAFEKIEVGMKTLADAQLAVTKTSRALTQLMSAKSLAEASDTAQEIITLTCEITALTKDIAELTTRLQSLRYKPKPEAPVADPKVPVAPTSVGDFKMFPPDNSTSGGSRWQDVYVSSSVKDIYTASSDRSAASTSKSDVSLFFGSYHSESSESSASSSAVDKEASTKVELGFRATMVTVDRGGWFQPQFFKQSAGFHNIDPSISWSKWPDNITSINQLAENNGAAYEHINKNLLPAFPVGFLICKDITIKIHMESNDMKKAGEEMEKYSATSAGILCFSTSSSNTSKASDKSYAFNQTEDGCVIRIPGPQILGYILQFTDSDKTTPIPDKLPTGFLVSDADYNTAFADKPSRDLNPAAEPTKVNKPVEPIPKS